MKKRLIRCHINFCKKYCVFNGNASTGYFNIGKGVRQGDPLSPYLFMLCIEIVAQAIRSEDAIHGIIFDNAQIKQILYADDLTIFVRDSESINILDKLLGRFAGLSGLKINTDKTFILLLGPHTNTE